MLQQELPTADGLSHLLCNLLKNNEFEKPVATVPVRLGAIFAGL